MLLLRLTPTDDSKLDIFFSFVVLHRSFILLAPAAVSAKHNNICERPREPERGQIQFVSVSIFFFYFNNEQIVSWENVEK